MSFPRYERYKDSGVAWLGEVPEHWEVAPFFTVASEREEPNTSMAEDNLLSLSYGRIVQKNINSNDGLLPESFETYQIVRQGDIVFRLTDLQNDKRSHRTAIVGDTGIITSAYVAAVPFSISPSYLGHLLRAYDVLKVFYSMGGGLRQSMKFSDLKRLPTLVPSLEEQQTIAAFLGRETSKIDALIAEQRRLIDLLKEKRQAAISHAVTKGLNPDAPMKDSGVEWLGQVPGHWAIQRLKHLTPEVTVGIVVTPAKYYVEEGVSCLRSLNVKEGALIDTDLVFISQANNELLGKSMIFSGDLVAVRTGQPGATAVVDERFHECNCIDLIIVRKSRCLDSSFLCYLANSRIAKIQVSLGSEGAIQQHFNIETAKHLLVLQPPLIEQQVIVRFLDRETARLDALVAEAETAIALLQERRAALISAAVTGTIDVRGLVTLEAGAA